MLIRCLWFAGSFKSVINGASIFLLMVLPFDTRLDLSGHIGKPLSAHRKKFQSSCPLLLLPLLFPILLALNGNQLWELYMSPSLPPYGMGPRRMRCLCTSTLVPMSGKWTAGKYNKFYCQAQLSSLKPQLKLNFSSISSFPPPTHPPPLLRVFKA